MIGDGHSRLRDWRFVLASASPSRLRLLRSAGVEPEVIVSAVDERELEARFASDDPTDLAVHLAQAKAQHVAAGLTHALGTDPENPDDVNAHGVLVLGADSILNVDGQRQGKPGTAERALARARALQGRSARLVTGHCLIAVEPSGQTHELTRAAQSAVHFGRTSEVELQAYVASGEPLNVAGGFTLDGLSAPFIEGISGDPSNVIGLSLPTLRDMLQQWGIAWIP